MINLLIAIDLSESTEIVLNTTQMISKAISSKIWFLHVAEPDPDFVGFDAGPQSVRDSVATNYRNEHRQIQKIAERFRTEDVDATALLVQGSVAETILNKASRLNIDMIIMGSHGKGAMSQLLLGSVSKGVLRKSKRPVLIVPTHEKAHKAI